MYFSVSLIIVLISNIDCYSLERAYIPGKLSPLVPSIQKPSLYPIFGEGINPWTTTENNKTRSSAPNEAQVETSNVSTNPAQTVH